MRYSNILIALSIVLVGCKPDLQEPNVPEVTQLSDGMLVLCEGLFQHNNATISWVTLPSGESDRNFFETKTARGLGDTGNDMQRYGGKIYIVVNVSSTIEVMDAHDFSPLKHIEMMQNGQSKQPRSLAFANGNAYVTCFDGYVDVIDTLTLNVIQRIPVGENPEGLAVANNKLYVANSGGLNFPNVDSTLSVIDLNSHTELQKITVGKNPGAVLANSSGAIFVIARGDYGSTPSRLRKIDSNTDQLINDSYSFDVTGIAPMSSSQMLVYNASGIRRFDYAVDGLDYSYPINISQIYTLYGVAYHPIEDCLYILDAMNYTNQGYVRKFALDGTLLSSYQTGLNPSRILFFQ